MANKRDKDLQQTLQAAGVRKKVARALTESAGRANGGKRPKTITRTAENLRAAASELEGRASGSRRSAAAKKAADTRKRKAAQRSAAARKGAKTRAKLA